MPSARGAELPRKRGALQDRTGGAAHSLRALGVGPDDVSYLLNGFHLDGAPHAFGPTVVRYDDRWYLASTGGLLSGTYGISNIGIGPGPES